MGVYCRTCLYDLRGQDTPRCPECGRAFDPGDPGSFLDRPDWAHRARLVLEKARIPCAIVLTGVWVIWMLLGLPWLGLPRDVGGIQYPLRQLHMIVVQRMLWQQQNPPIRDFNRAVAVRDLPPQQSAHKKQARMQRAKRLSLVGHCVTFYAVSTSAFVLLLAPLVRHRRRRLAPGVFAVCCVLGLAAYNIHEISDVLWPQDAPLGPSHAYLDDYVHIDGIQFTSVDDEGNTTIAAYDVRSFSGDGRRVVAFANTHVRSLADEEARALFEAQGLEYPAQEEAGGGE
jgi:hypothetical protein